MRFLAALLFVAATPVFAGPAVFVEMPSGGAVTGLDAGTLHQLVRQATSQMGYDLAPNSSEATITLRSALLKLGTTLVLTIERIENGKITQSSKLKAANVEEMDVVTERVVRAVLSGKIAKEDARPTDVTTDEAFAGTRRRVTRSGTNLAGGMSFGSGMATSGVGYYFGLDRAWAMGPFYVSFGFELAALPNGGGSTGFLGGVHIGAQYYFLDRDFSPFVGLDFGPSFLRDGNGDWRSGVGLGGSVGVGLFRTYDVHARAGFRVASVLTTDAPTTPVVMAVFLGVGF